ncbi:MAG TPA: hydrogenase maturation protease [Candidatus Bathyarchaeia archaeon]|nr:hydrogenase maturation protease [Candidatus Bathyarchaeia archaeon]
MVKGDYDLEKELKKWLKDADRIVIAGIGNPIRMDDFVGVKIAQDLKRLVSDRVMLLECETVPESYVQQILDFGPTHLLLIDAAILGLRPGEAKLVSPDYLIGSSAFSTHLLPLRIFCEYLRKESKISIALLLIEPKRTDFGEGLEPEISASASKITESLSKILSEKT